MPFLAVLLIMIFSFTAHAAPLASITSLVLDAGHGPDDAAPRPQAFAELTPAQLLAGALKEVVDRENGGAVGVFFTFAPKSDLRQTERALAVNAAEGKLFISIHPAAGFGKPSKAAVIVPSAPEAPAKSWKAVYKKYSTKNGRIAEVLKNALAGFYGQQNVISGAAPLWAFNGVDMPAVALEVPFPDDASIALNPFYRNIAEVLYSAIVEYDK